uniref:Movement protein n=1 Tax=Heterorhabditis bacteriophora TaxID=37862 RepID=A0A1I7XG47_HETBA
MSVDQTIQELSGTLAQLSTLVAHINGQISGITGRINQTLDNFDLVPNSWVFYLLFITLIVVFILLSVVLVLNLITKVHAIWRLIKNKEGSERVLISSRDDSFEKSQHITAISTPYSQASQCTPIINTVGFQSHVSIPMDQEPRRVGITPRRDMRSLDQSMTDDPRPYQRRLEDSGKYNAETGTTSAYPRSLEV